MTRFGILLPSISMDHIYLKKVSSTNDTVVIKSSLSSSSSLQDTDNNILFPCCYGYHVHIKGFEDCIFLDMTHALYFESIPILLHPFHSLLKEMMSCHLVTKPYRIQLKRMLKNLPIIRHADVNVFPIYENDDSSLHCDLLSLVDIHLDTSAPRTLPKMDNATIRREMDKTYDIFHKEYDILRSKFSSRRNMQCLTRDWFQILRLYKKDFFQNPDTTLPIIRRLLYQYMVDHSFNHINFKSFDLPRMITALYLWSQWYERYFHEYVGHEILQNYHSKELLIVIGCLDLFFEKDPLDYTERFLGCDNKDLDMDMTIHEFVLGKPSVTYYNVDHEKFCAYFHPIHPMMRASYLSKLSENQYKDFCKNT